MSTVYQHRHRDFLRKIEQQAEVRTPSGQTADFTYLHQSGLFVDQAENPPAKRLTSLPVLDMPSAYCNPAGFFQIPAQSFQNPMLVIGGYKFVTGFQQKALQDELQPIGGVVGDYQGLRRYIEQLSRSLMSEPCGLLVQVRVYGWIPV